MVSASFPSTGPAGPVTACRRLTGRPYRVAALGLAWLLTVGVAQLGPASAPAGAAAVETTGATISASVRPMESPADATGSRRYVDGADPDTLADAKKVVDARRYRVTLRLSDCSPGMTYHWFVRATASDGTSPLVGTESYCAGTTIEDVPAGELTVTAKAFNGTSTAFVSAATVKVGTRVVVGLGESYAAGEGLPPYDDAACHRSESGLQGRISDAASADVPVLFVHLACSGANTASMFSSSAAPYEGATVAAQLADLQKVIDVFGVPDAVLLSGGGNDLPYTAYMFQCGRNAGACQPSNADTADRTADIRAHIDTAVAATRANYDLFASCLNGATGSGDLSLPVHSGNSLDNMMTMDRYAVPVSCPLTTPVPADRVLMTGYPNGLTGPDGYCTTSLFGVIDLNAEQSRWLDENFQQLLSDLTRSTAESKGWHYTSTYEAFGTHGTCAPEADRWIFDLLGAGLEEVHGSWHPNDAGAGQYAALAGPALAEMLAVKGEVTQRHEQTITVCHTHGGSSATVTLAAADATVDRDRVLTLRTSAGQVDVTLRADTVEYRTSVPVDPAALGRVTMHDADVSPDTATQAVDIPDDECTEPAPIPPAGFACPPIGRPAGDNPNRIPAGGPGPDDQTVDCDLTEPMALLAHTVYTSYMKDRDPEHATSDRLKIVGDMNRNIVVVPAGHVRATYRSVRKDSGGYLYDGTALELTVTDPAGTVLFTTQGDLFASSIVGIPYPAQVADAATLVEMHNADDPSDHEWWAHTVSTHWFVPYCDVVSGFVREPVDGSGDQWGTWNDARYLVNRTSLFGTAAGAPSCA